MATEAVSNLEEQFEASVKLVRALPQKGSMQPSYEDAAKVYAFYKQAKFGECEIAKPSFWDPVGRAKWDAWSAIKGMPKEEAMKHYVDFIKEMFDKFQNTEEFQEKQADYSHVVVPFCEAIGKSSPSNTAEKDESVLEISNTIKLNGSLNIMEKDVSNHVDGHKKKVKYYNGDGERLEGPRQPVVRINGTCEHYIEEPNSASLSRSIIENILRSGEDLISKPSSDVVIDPEIRKCEGTGQFVFLPQDSFTHKAAPDSDDSGDEIYCDSLGELPNPIVAVSNSAESVEASIIMIERPVNGLDHSVPEETMASAPDSNTESTSTPARDAQPVALSENLVVNGSHLEPCMEEAEHSNNTDLSSLSSASGFEQVGLTESMTRLNGEYETEDTKENINHVELSMGSGVSEPEDELAFLNDCRNPASDTLHRHKGGVKKRTSKKNDRSKKTTEERHHTSCSKNSVLPTEGSESKSKDDMSGNQCGVVTMSHGNGRPMNGSTDHRRGQQRSRSNNGYPDRMARTSNRTEGRSNSSGNGSDRHRQTSSSSESDGYGNETIGEKILHCLERLERDVEGIKDRLSSIEKGITAISERPNPWWYDYIPSKTVTCLILWPILLNFMIRYIRSRKRKLPS